MILTFDRSFLDMYPGFHIFNYVVARACSCACVCVATFIIVCALIRRKRIITGLGMFYRAFCKHSVQRVSKLGSDLGLSNSCLGHRALENTANNG